MTNEERAQRIIREKVPHEMLVSHGHFEWIQDLTNLITQSLDEASKPIQWPTPLEIDDFLETHVPYSKIGSEMSHEITDWQRIACRKGIAWLKAKLNG